MVAPDVNILVKDMYCHCNKCFYIQYTDIPKESLNLNFSP